MMSITYSSPMGCKIGMQLPCHKIILKVIMFENTKSFTLTNINTKSFTLANINIDKFVGNPK